VTWVKRKLILIHLEIVLIRCKIGARFASNVPLAWKSLWAHPMVLLGNVCQVKLVSVSLEIVLVSAQDRCIACAERPIGLEIILAHPMVLLGDVAQEEARFSPFRDSVNLDTR
jgi:hypothetical protein